MDGKSAVTDATWLILDRLSMLLGLVTGSITLFVLVVGYFNRERLRRWLTRNRFPAIGVALAENVRYDGLVFTVSKQKRPRGYWVRSNPGVWCLWPAHNRAVWPTS